MKSNPILIVAGEPFSVFVEIFLKSFKKIKSKEKIVLIVSKTLFTKQMKALNFNLKLF